MIHRFQHLTHTRSRLPRLAGVVIKVDDVVAGLVAMRILSNQTSDVWRGILAHIAFHNEQRIEFVDKGFVATEGRNKSPNIMRNEPNVLPCRAFGVVIGAVNDLKGVERFAEMAFRINAPHELCLLVEVEIAIGLAALVEILVVFLVL